MATLPASTGQRPCASITPHMIRQACNRHGIAVSTFGRRAVGDPRLYFDLRGGRFLRATTRNRVLAFIAQLGEA